MWGLRRFRAMSKKQPAAQSPSALKGGVMRSVKPDTYHKALVRGRDPRSFKENADVWHYVAQTRDRTRKVHDGQHLWAVLDDEVDVRETAQRRWEEEQAGMASDHPLDIIEQSLRTKAKAEGKAEDAEAEAETKHHHHHHHHNSHKSHHHQSPHARELEALKMQRSFTGDDPMEVKAQRMGARLSQFRVLKKKEMAILVRQAQKAHLLVQSRKGGRHGRGGHGHGSSHGGSHGGSQAGGSHYGDTPHRTPQISPRGGGGSGSPATTTGSQQRRDSYMVLQQTLQSKFGNDGVGRSPVKKGGGGGGAQGASGAQVVGGAAGSSAAAAAAASVELSPQVGGRLHYGSTIALESVWAKDKFLRVVRGTTGAGAVGVGEMPRVRNERETGVYALFRVIDLTDLNRADAVRQGDEVWLQLTPGTGENWEHGSVLGAEVRCAPTIKTVPHGKNRTIRQPDGTTPDVGRAFALKALLPTPREHAHHVDAAREAMLHRHHERNKLPGVVGRWRVRPALKSAVAQLDALMSAAKAYGADHHHDDDDGGHSLSHAPPKPKPIENFDEVCIVQDWFALHAQFAQSGQQGADNGPTCQLCQLPSEEEQDLSSQYACDRRGAWRVRLVEAQTTVGSSAAQQRMERLLIKAKAQLKSSEQGRNGEGHEDPDNDGLVGGAKFSRTLRAALKDVNQEYDEELREPLEDKFDNLHDYFGDRHKGHFGGLEGVTAAALEDNEGLWNSLASPSVREKAARAAAMERSSRRQSLARRSAAADSARQPAGRVVVSRDARKAAPPPPSKSASQSGEDGSGGDSTFLTTGADMSATDQVDAAARMSTNVLLNREYDGAIDQFFDLPRLLHTMNQHDSKVLGVMRTERERELQLLIQQRKRRGARALENADTDTSKISAGSLPRVPKSCDAAMLAAMSDTNTIVPKLEHEDAQILSHLEYSEKHARFSDLYDSLPGQQVGGGGSKGARKTMAVGGSGHRTTRAGMGGAARHASDAKKPGAPLAATSRVGAGLAAVLHPGDAALVQADTAARHKKGAIDMAAAMERFDNNFGHLKDMLLSLHQLCDTRVVPQLKAAREAEDPNAVKDEAAFLEEAATIIAADELAASAVALGEAASKTLAAVGGEAPYPPCWDAELEAALQSALQHAKAALDFIDEDLRAAENAEELYSDLKAAGLAT